MVNSGTAPIDNAHKTPMDPQRQLTTVAALRLDHSKDSTKYEVTAS